ncbi:MAG: hypothetical protein ABH804_03215 [archaeon]
MEGERKSEEFEDDRKKWKIYFDLESDSPGGESVVMIRFRRSENGKHFLNTKDLEKLKQDLRDLGKLRIIKQGKDFLEG